MIGQRADGQKRVVRLGNALLLEKRRGQVDAIAEALLQLHQERDEPHRIDDRFGAEEVRVSANRTDVRGNRRRRIDHGLENLSFARLLTCGHRPHSST